MLLLLLSIAFIFTAFLPSQLPDKAGNLFFAYYIQQINIISPYWILIVFTVILLSIFFSFTQKSTKGYPILKRYFFAKWYVFKLLIASFLLSYVFLFFIAFLQLNVFAIIINTNPKILGIKTDIIQIVSTLRKNNMAPDIIASDSDPAKALAAVAKATTGRSNFYGRFILESVPDLFVLSINESDSNLLLLDNSLIVISINRNDLEDISPTVSYLFAKQYFWGRYIKSYPEVNILDKKEYLKYRKLDSNKKINTLNDEILRVETVTSSLSAKISNFESIIFDNQEELENAKSERESGYQACISDNYPELYCQNQQRELDDIIKDMEKDLELLTDELSLAQDQLISLSYYEEFFKTQKQVIQSQTAGIPYEMGFFEPPDKIHIDFKTESPHAIADYFVTLMHEYLHYASFKGDDIILDDSFFEEALTEYFARETILHTLNVSTNLAYPVHAEIIKEMTKNISESDFADVYFNKDQERLEEILNLVYGENFYENNRSLFATLQYTSDPEQGLRLVNEIMEKIGGNPLSIEDLKSTSSEI